jgi:hypothetical protein
VPVHLGPIQSPILTIVPTLGLYIVEQEGMMTLYQTLIKEQIPTQKGRGRYKMRGLTYYKEIKAQK